MGDKGEIQGNFYKLREHQETGKSKYNAVDLVWILIQTNQL